MVIWIGHFAQFFWNFFEIAIIVKVQKMTTWCWIIPRVFWVSLVWLDNRPLFGSSLIFNTLGSLIHPLPHIHDHSWISDESIWAIHDYSGTYNESLFIYKLNYKQIAWNCLYFIFKASGCSCLLQISTSLINDFNSHS